MARWPTDRWDDISQMSGNRDQMMKKWLRAIATIGKYLLQGIGAIGGVITIIGRDNVIRYLEQYLPVALIIFIFLATLALYILLAWWIGRDISRVIRGWIQKRRDIRQFRTLAVRIAQIIQLVDERHIHSLSNSAEFTVYLEQVAATHAPLRDELVRLGIPAPGSETAGMYQMGIHIWEAYLNMLLPLAIVGDIDEARMIMSRIEEQESSDA